MGRKIRSNLPQTSESLIPEWSYLKEFQGSNHQLKLRQKADFDHRHRVRPLPEIPENTDVWVNTGEQRIPGRVSGHANTPRSYLVDTPHGQLRWNRAHINPIPNTTSAPATESQANNDRSPIMTHSRTGTRIAPPERL